MAVILTRRESSPIPLEVFGLTPNKLAGLLPAEIARLPVRHGNRTEPVGEHFAVAGENPLDLRFEGDCTTVKGIGAGMTSGLVSAGAVGSHAGAGMTGGRLSVDSAGDWLGAETAGGVIQVAGDAGHHVGAAFPGSRRGMRGGRIVVGGDAGDEVGCRLRRGVIEINGRSGAFLGADVIAGTIIARGGAGPRSGAGMKRGTVVLFGAEPDLPPGFVFACEYEPTFARFVDPIRTVRLYRGDLTTGGRGEIWHVPTPG